MEMGESFHDHFGQNVFSDAVMKRRLAPSVYLALRRVIDEGEPLASELADEVAAAMRDWAVERGATHYTHWFAPLRGLSAEKHDSFLTPDGKGGAILEFSGRELIRGEADASSFPAGGLRATFEARGYTAWDCTSPAFVREDPSGIVVLCIPTAFCSYNGEALDGKTPLLRSIEAIDRQSRRVLSAMGEKKVRRVTVNVGCEQEYFLVEKRRYRQRKDLSFTGRTLFGAPPPKGQELNDQYYATIRQPVSEFMAELNRELWKLGVSAKTQHNEAAPAQHELACLYGPANIAADHNQIVMETMKKVADRRDMVCLLHEKPFQGIAGSGKHNNWSLQTDTGVNLLSPVKDGDNTLFLLFFMAVIAAVDRHAELLRQACAAAGNDCRLGGHEAPPYVISVFIGQELSELVAALERGELRNARHRNRFGLGVATMPQLRRDNTDRNRTSPFAFTGNKFEFRMLGSSMSVFYCNMILNTIVAETLSDMADVLEKAENKDAAAHDLLMRMASDHKRILFDGDNYSEEWLREAEKRGLPSLKNPAEANKALVRPEAIAMFEKLGIMNEAEVRARAAIANETYVKTVRIEGRTMVDMARRELLPAAMRHASALAEAVSREESVGVEPMAQKAILLREQGCINAMLAGVQGLEKELATLDATESMSEAAQFCPENILPAMAALRAPADELEGLVAGDIWPIPTYGELLFPL